MSGCAMRAPCPSTTKAWPALRQPAGVAADSGIGVAQHGRDRRVNVAVARRRPTLHADDVGAGDQRRRPVDDVVNLADEIVFRDRFRRGRIQLAAVHDADADVRLADVDVARLLVDEIKLYNQAKVAEGRKHKDLYDRLKETIEKSRATYQKRYGKTVAASGNYFQNEIIRSLAEDDLSILGADFRQ